MSNSGGFSRDPASAKVALPNVISMGVKNVFGNKFRGMILDPEPVDTAVRVVLFVHVLRYQIRDEEQRGIRAVATRECKAVFHIFQS